MSREQAEVVARGLTTMFIHNFDSLVTKDYLGTRFTEFETRVNANMNKQFADFRLEVCGETGTLRSEMIDGFGNLRMEMHSETGTLRTEMIDGFGNLGMEMQSEIGTLRTEMHSKIGSLRGDLAGFHSTQKLHSWMFALLATGIFTPILQDLFS